jgi:hypothetical protein
MDNASQRRHRLVHGFEDIPQLLERSDIGAAYDYLSAFCF